MNGNPSKIQKDWHDWLREYGCQITGQPYPTIQHIIGARRKLKGVKGLAGEWYCYGLCFELHLGDHPNSLKISKKRFVDEFGTEKEIWIRAVLRYELEKGQKPMTEEEFKIIV